LPASDHGRSAPDFAARWSPPFASAPAAHAGVVPGVQVRVLARAPAPTHPTHLTNPKARP
jgi:hypothetical protein